MRVVVLGGGATGLVTAYLLARAGVEVVVVEAADRPGGLLAAFDIGDGHLLEHYYHHFFTHDVELRWLLQELQLTDRAMFRRGCMGVYRGGRSWSFNGALDLLRFRPIGLLDRLRFGASSAVLSWNGSLAEKEDEPCLPWFDRWAGRAATDAIWRPLLRGKFGASAERVPLAWMAGRLRQRARSRSLEGEKLGYLTGSFQVLVDQLVQAIERLGGRLHLRTKVTGLAESEGKICGARTVAEVLAADAVVATLPTHLLAPLVRPLSAPYADALDRIQYLGAICVVATSSRALSEYYWTNVTENDLPFRGVIEHTRFIPATDYGGRHIIYLSRYLPIDDPLWTASEEELAERAAAQLEAMFGAHARENLQHLRVFRARSAAPAIELGFHRLIPAMRSPLEGLYVASMCHVYPDERSTNNCIRVAAELVRAMGHEAVADLVPRGLSLAAKYGQCPPDAAMPAP